MISLTHFSIVHEFFNVFVESSKLIKYLWNDTLLNFKDVDFLLSVSFYVEYSDKLQNTMYDR